MRKTQAHRTHDVGAGLPVQVVRAGVDAVSVSSVSCCLREPQSDANRNTFRFVGQRLVPDSLRKHALRAAHIYVHLCSSAWFAEGQALCTVSGLYLRDVVVVCCFVFLGL